MRASGLLLTFDGSSATPDAFRNVRSRFNREARLVRGAVAAVRDSSCRGVLAGELHAIG
jgi:hypothetical protein